MKPISFHGLRRNLAAILDGVTKDRRPVIVTCESGKPSVVLLSHEDFASYEESCYLMRSPRNADRLLRAVAELRAHCQVR